VRVAALTSPARNGPAEFDGKAIAVIGYESDQVRGAMARTLYGERWW
jgi:hypothetical protein